MLKSRARVFAIHMGACAKHAHSDRHISRMRVSNNVFSKLIFSHLYIPHGLLAAEPMQSIQARAISLKVFSCLSRVRLHGDPIRQGQDDRCGAPTLPESYQV